MVSLLDHLDRPVRSQVTEGEGVIGGGGRVRHTPKIYHLRSTTACNKVDLAIAAAFVHADRDQYLVTPVPRSVA